MSLPLREKDGKIHIPTLARKVLDELRYSGLLHRRDVEPPENIRRAKVGNRQEVWIRFDTYRGDAGYVDVDVVDAPRSDVAILAAMTAFLMEPVDPGQVAEAFRFYSSEARETQEELVRTTFKKRLENPNDVTDEELVNAINTRLELNEKEKPLLALSYILPLLSYYKPDIRNHPEPESLRYAEVAYNYVNNFLKSLRNLQGFLEYGDPSRKKLTPAVKQAKRDVKAAVLRDVDELSYLEIGNRLGVPLPLDFEVKGEHQTGSRNFALRVLRSSGCRGPTVRAPAGPGVTGRATHHPYHELDRLLVV